MRARLYLTIPLEYPPLFINFNKNFKFFSYKGNNRVKIIKQRFLKVETFKINFEKVFYKKGKNGFWG